MTMYAVVVTEGYRKIKLQYYGFKLASDCYVTWNSHFIITVWGKIKVVLYKFVFCALQLMTVVSKVYWCNYVY